MTPTAKALDFLRTSGFTVAIVESWIPHVNRRRDLWGFADILAIHPRREPRHLLLQVTSLSNMASRLNKAKRKGELRTWLACGNGFEVWGLTKRSGLWTFRRVAVTGADLSDVLIDGPARRSKRRTQQELFA